MDVDAYLRRIGHAGARDPSAATLRALHEAHVRSVPFENLDIGRGRPIVLDEEALLQKIVDERRGGFCYELNGAFAALLRALGFDVTLLSARVARPDGTLGPEFDHLCLRVALDEPYLADVGFGDHVLQPLRLDLDGQQRDRAGLFRIARPGGGHAVERRVGDPWKVQYAFSLEPRALADFSAMCQHHQTSPASPFTRGDLCTLPTAEGRITLTADKLVVTRRGLRQEVALAPEERTRVLRERFGITLPTPSPGPPSA